MRVYHWMAFIRLRILVAAILVVLCPINLQAQSQTEPKLRVAWAPLSPLIYEDRNGEVVGFMVDLAHELGREVGFVPEFFRVDGFPEWAAAQGSGASALSLGVTDTLPFNQTNLFSAPIFDAEVNLAIRSGEEDLVALGNVAGLRIGTLRPGAGSNPALYPDAVMPNYANVNAALFALLAGDIDAISTTSTFVYSAARAAGIDHRIAFVEAAVPQSERFVAVHESQIALLDPINAALARMKEDGRLAALLNQHDVVIPPRAPEVLTVGVTDFPPYSVVRPDGTFSGFGVETFRDLADLAGLNLTFRTISPDEFSAGPAAGTYDIFPQIGVNAVRLEVMDFTLPLRTTSASIFTRAGEAEGLSDLDSLVGRIVGVEDVNVGRRQAENHGGLTTKVIKGRPALLQALVDGTVDAILFTTTPMNLEIKSQSLTNEIEEVAPPFYVTTRAPALRLGLGTVREQLNALIPAYLISDDYKALQETWFGEPVFWTQARIRASMIAAIGAIIALIGLLGWSRYQQKYRQQQRDYEQQSDYEQQRRELDQEQRHSAELGRLVTDLERSNRELNDFAYVASHDLKEPLRGIAINADFLLREKVSDEGKDRILRMVYLTSRMEQLISDLLFFSRLGRSDKAIQKVDPAKVVSEILASLREMLAECGGTIEVAPDLPAVYAEAAKVKIVFQNLIVNGLRYNDAEDKLIKIGFLNEVQVQGETLNNVFFLRDNGIGIAKKEHEKIFRIFTRLNREADYGRGTGAGLSFVKKIIEEYGGVIVLASKIEGGTTFYFSLPLDGNTQKERTRRG